MVTQSLLTVSEVAETLKVTRYTVWRYIREGKMAVVRLGSDYRVKPDDLLNFINRRTAGGDHDNHESR